MTKRLKIIEWDNKALLTMDPIRSNRHWRKVFLALTVTGNGGLYVAITILICSVDSRGPWPFLSAVTTSFALGLPLHILIKKWVKRQRPCEDAPKLSLGLIEAERFSFPSGHTTHAFLMAAILASFFPVLTAPLFLWAGLVGLSRLYLGVHYPSDVLAGFLLGQACAWLGLMLVS